MGCLPLKVYIYDSRQSPIKLQDWPYDSNSPHVYGAIQVLRKCRGWGCPISWKSSVIKVYSSTLLALRGGGYHGSLQKALRNN